jgi:uncharacterized protein (TIGR01777 family)
LSKIVIAGASGFVGSKLCPRLQRAGHEVVALDRSRKELPDTDRVVRWDGASADAWIEELEAADTLINLSGSSIAVKRTSANRERIWQSRVASMAILAEACRLVTLAPRTWINMSAIGIYEPNLEEPLAEDGPLAQGFLGELGRAWEGAMFEAELPATRRVALRAAVVLGPGGGAFEVHTKLVRAFLGGSAGSGRQWMSWIHVEDMLRLIEWAMAAPGLAGPVNASSPSPVRNGEFMAELRKAHGRPWAPPAPAWAIKLVGLLGGPDPSLALDGYRVHPKKAMDLGFEFSFPTLPAALQDLVRK